LLTTKDKAALLKLNLGQLLLLELPTSIVLGTGKINLIHWRTVVQASFKFGRDKDRGTAIVVPTMTSSTPIAPFPWN
jgi:hypothetical protein